MKVVLALALLSCIAAVLADFNQVKYLKMSMKFLW